MPTENVGIVIGAVDVNKLLCGECRARFRLSKMHVNALHAQNRIRTR